MPLPDLTGLPPWAVVAFGISLAIIFAFVWLGISNGRKMPASSSAKGAEVAAVIVDSSALKMATAAIEAINMTLVETNRVGRALIDSNIEVVQAKDRQAESVEGLRNELRETSREVRELAREVGKARP